MGQIRQLDPAGDAEAAFRLWERTVGELWPLRRERFDERLGRGLVAIEGGEVVAVSLFADGALQLVLVDPARQGRGLGRLLHEMSGVERLGGLPGPYFWPGVPENLGVMAVFERWGWEVEETTWDLSRSLRGYETPPEVAQIACRTASPAEVAAFEERHFPHWAADFASGREPVIALDEGGAIVGSLLVGRDWLWDGRSSGTIACVGVSEAARGGGVGTALTAFACELLRDRGVDDCYIDYTTRLDFYGRLGFTPWRQYDSASRNRREP
jgi:GNAT superfamily N-acetyltransferase